MISVTLGQMRRLCGRALLLAVVLIGMATGGALACTVCIAVPEATVADRLLAAETVVLARENPDKPFTYIGVEVLAGTLESPEIDLFVNSSLRRKLRREPERAVLLVLEPERTVSGNSWAAQLVKPKPGELKWSMLGFATERFEAVAREILKKAPEWEAATTAAGFDPRYAAFGSSEERVQYFLPYLADTDQRSRLLAYLEVGRAPYDQIRNADDYVTSKQVWAFLGDFKYIEWHALYILLLGINATENEKEVIRQAMASRQRFDNTLNLGAWAAALIEVDGEDAIDWLDEKYLGAQGRESASVSEIVKALSVHGTNGRTELRSRIAESYALALQTHPNASSLAAVDLMVWKDQRFTEIAQDILAQDIKLDPSTEFALRNYAMLGGG